MSAQLGDADSVMGGAESLAGHGGMETLTLRAVTTVTGASMALQWALSRQELLTLALPEDMVDQLRSARSVRCNTRRPAHFSIIHALCMPCRAQ